MQTLLTALLIERFFGAGFGLDRLRHVLGLLAAAVVATVVAGVWWIIVSTLLKTSTEPIVSTAQHWFMSDIVGFIATGPFVIGLFATIGRPPPRRELIEGIAALLALAMTTGAMILLPRELWAAALPITWLFPMLLWLAARCRPVFSAAAAFFVSIAVVPTAVLGIGHFGDAVIPISYRILQAQISILFAALGALILAALFAERRQSEACLARSNLLLQRERDNKLMNFEAVAASISHEISQPLAAIRINVQTAMNFLERRPFNDQKIRAALNRIDDDGRRTKEILDGILSLFRKSDQERHLIDLNEIIFAVLRLSEEEFSRHNVTVLPLLANELPLIEGSRSQIQQVIFNLVHNAVDAMAATTDRTRMLRLRTQHRSDGVVAVAVEDSGPGIDPAKLNALFDPFVTTKAHGMGLGLAICRAIVDRHGGRISACSDGKSGAFFEFILPTPSRPC
jgi:signal transduction histidine kinase